MAGETETVSLNLDGSFAAAANTAASGAAKLGSSLEAVGASAAKAEGHLVKLRAAAKGAGGLGEGVVKGLGGSMPTALMGSLVQGGFAKIVGGIGKLFGDNAASSVIKGAGALADVSDKIAPFAPLLGVAGDLVGAGGAVVGKAAVALTAAAVAVAAGAGALLVAGAKFGIEVTDTAKTQKAVFDAIGKGASYDKAVKIATELGIPEETAIAKTKALLNAKLDQSSVKDIIKVGIGLDAVQGEGAGDKFAKTLEKIKNVGKFDAKSIKEFAKEGIAADDVYKALAKTMGITADEAKAKVKAGTLDVNKGIGAVVDVAKGKFGKIADVMADSVPALILKVKQRITDLFKDFDLGPIKSFLKNVDSVLGGPVGKGLKDALSELFGSIGGLFKGINAGDIKGVLTPAIGMFKDLANTVRANAPGLKAFGRSLASFSVGALGLVVTYLKGVVRFTAFVGQSWEGLIQLINGGPDAGKTKKVPGTLDQVRQAVQMMLSPLKTAQQAWGLFESALTRGAAKVMGAARTIGKAFSSGLSGGILGGLSAAVAAAAKMATAALAKVRSILGVASPAKALVFVGDSMAGGMAKGMNDSTAPAKAAGKMAAGAAKAAGGGAAGAGGGGGGGGAGGGAAPTVNITNNFAPGTTPGQAAALATANGEEWKRMMRAWQREQQEGRAA